MENNTTTAPACHPSTEARRVNGSVFAKLGVLFRPFFPPLLKQGHFPPVKRGRLLDEGD